MTEFEHSFCCNLGDTLIFKKLFCKSFMTLVCKNKLQQLSQLKRTIWERQLWKADLFERCKNAKTSFLFVNTWILVHNDFRKMTTFDHFYFQIERLTVKWRAMILDANCGYPSMDFNCGKCWWLSGLQGDSKSRGLGFDSCCKRSFIQENPPF